MSGYLNEESLTETLNALLDAISIPFTLSSPLELTPSLILAIFESMLRTRLPLSPETRKLSTYRSRVDAMKIVIGVLADDILGVAGEVDSNLSLNTASTGSTILGRGLASDASDSKNEGLRRMKLGFGDLDPRKLAQGHKEEVLRIAGILCWLAKKMHYVSGDGRSIREITLLYDKTAKAASDHFDFEMVRGQHEDKGEESDTAPTDFGFQEMERSTLSLSSGLTESFDSSLLKHSMQSTQESETTVSGHDDEIGSEDDIGLISEFSHSFEPMSYLEDNFEGTKDSLVSSDHIIEVRDEDISLPPLSPRPEHRRRFSKNSSANTESDLSIEFARGKPESTSISYCHCSGHPSHHSGEVSNSSGAIPPLRTSGELYVVNFDNEIRNYETWREQERGLSSRCSTCSQLNIHPLKTQLDMRGHTFGITDSDFLSSEYRTPHRPTYSGTHNTPSTGILIRHNSPSQYTLALLNERARLLSELSKMKHERTRT